MDRDKKLAAPNDEMNYETLHKFYKQIDSKLNHFYKEEILKYSEPIVVFQRDGAGKAFLNCLTHIGKAALISSFCDNDENIQNTEISGIPVLSFDEIQKRYKNPLIIICCEWEGHRSEITEQIGGYGQILHKDIVLRVAENVFMQMQRDDKYYKTWFHICSRYYKEESFKNNVKTLNTLITDEASKQTLNNRINFFLSGDIKYLANMYSGDVQYFSKDYYNDSLTKNEIFVDLGAFDGDTIESMIAFVGDNYEKIYAFEPNPENYNKLIKRIQDKKWKNIETFQLGTGIKKSKVSFDMTDENGYNSSIDLEGDSEIEVDALDHIIKEPVTWIKMDVEGAELSTLKGAKRLIRTYKPKLSISLYHKPLDIVKLPLYIHELVPEYRFKIVHHNYDAYETVLYADIY